MLFPKTNKSISLWMMGILFLFCLLIPFATHALDINISAHVPGCGDGIIDPLSEQCEGSNLNTTSCQDLGYTGGTLSCNSACTFTTVLCDGNNNSSPRRGSLRRFIPQEQGAPLLIFSGLSLPHARLVLLDVSHTTYHHFFARQDGSFQFTFTYPSENLHEATFLMYEIDSTRVTRPIEIHITLFPEMIIRIDNIVFDVIPGEEYIPFDDGGLDTEDPFFRILLNTYEDALESEHVIIPIDTFSSFPKKNTLRYIYREIFPQKELTFSPERTCTWCVYIKKQGIPTHSKIIAYGFIPEKITIPIPVSKFIALDAVSVVATLLFATRLLSFFV